MTSLQVTGPQGQLSTLGRRLGVAGALVVWCTQGGILKYWEIYVKSYIKKKPKINDTNKIPTGLFIHFVSFFFYRHKQYC